MLGSLVSSGAVSPSVNVVVGLPGIQLVLRQINSVGCVESLIHSVFIFMGFLCLGLFVVGKGFCCPAGEAGNPW